MRRSTVQRLSHCWAPDARARVTGRWVDNRLGLFCTVACAPVARQAFWWWAIMKQCVSDCVSSVHPLLSALSCTCEAPTAIHLLAYFASCIVCPILTPWNCTFIPLPLFCYVDVVKFGADACRCINHAVKPFCNMQVPVEFACFSFMYVCFLSTSFGGRAPLGPAGETQKRKHIVAVLFLYFFSFFTFIVACMFFLFSCFVLYDCVFCVCCRHGLKVFLSECRSSCKTEYFRLYRR